MKFWKEIKDLIRDDLKKETDEHFEKGKEIYCKPALLKVCKEKDHCIGCQACVEEPMAIRLADFRGFLFRMWKADFNKFRNKNKKKIKKKVVKKKAVKKKVLEGKILKAEQDEVICIRHKDCSNIDCDHGRWHSPHDYPNLKKTCARWLHCHHRLNNFKKTNSKQVQSVRCTRTGK